MDNFPLKILILGWVAFYSITIQLKCLDFHSNQSKKLIPVLLHFCFVFCRYPPPERGGGGGSVGSGSSYSSSDRGYGPPMDRGYSTSDRYSSADNRGYSSDRGYGDRYLQMNFHSNLIRTLCHLECLFFVTGYHFFNSHY